MASGSGSRGRSQQFSSATAVYATSVAYHDSNSGIRSQSRAKSRQRPPLPQLQQPVLLPSQLSRKAPKAALPSGINGSGSRGVRERAKSMDCVNGAPVAGARQPLGQLGQLNSSNATTTGRRSSLSLRDRGLVGLTNLGNTCYMNSILQCLSHTRPLLELLLRSGGANADTSAGRLVSVYRRLMREMWSSSAPKCVSPSDLRSGVARLAPRFRGSGQQDAQEFLRYLLDGLHEDLCRARDPRPRLPPIDYQKLDQMPDSEKADLLWKRYVMLENSPIVGIFVGQLKSTLECCHCHNKSTTFDPFWDLALPIPPGGRTTLSACLELFTNQETMDGNERPKCDTCKTHRRCLKSFSLYRLPTILVIHLMRFSGERSRMTKLNTLVEYPLHLDLSRYIDRDCQSANMCCQYTLYAVSQHSGTPYGGHYTAMVRHAYSPEQWVAFNDTLVNRGSADAIVSPQGYVLFYELQDDGLVR